MSDALEAVVGPTLEDLSLDEVESVPGSEHQCDSEVREGVSEGVSEWVSEGVSE